MKTSFFWLLLLLAPLHAGQDHHGLHTPPAAQFDGAAVHQPHCSTKLKQAPPVTTKPLRPQADRRFMRGSDYLNRRDSVRRKMAACTSAQWAALSGSAFANEVAASTDSCLGVLWTFDGNAATAVSESRVNSVISAINSESNNIPANAARLDMMLYYLQIAFYHEFYQGSITYSASTITSAGQAVGNIGSRSGFLNEGDAAIDSMRYQWSITVDSTNGTHLAIGGVESLLQRYRNNPALASDWYERSLVFNLFFSMSRQVGNYNISQGTNSPWYNLISSSLSALIRDYAVDVNYTADTEFIVNNAIYTLGNFSVLNATTSSNAHAYISQAFNTHPQYSGPWLRSVTDIDYFYNGTLYNGTVLDMNQIRADVKAIALPYEYSFDEGRLIFQTAIPLDKAEAMYDAMQEVESQFFRKTTFLDPTPGDLADILTLVIYGSPDDYAQYQPFLYGLNTNNGGIYIETWSTLFTYDRTPQDSYLTLEDLLRHEYVHYLDGRFVVVPTFNAGPMYDNDRLTWYAEGLAEWLVGSTRDLDILPRSTYVDLIARDSSRMTVAEITSASYNSGFRFYQYAGLYFTYMNAERPDLLVQLFDGIRSDNTGTVDALYNSMASSSAIQTGYNNYLDAQIAAMNNGTGLFAEAVPTVPTPTNLPGDNSAAIQQTLNANLPTTSGTLVTWNGRYQYTDQLSLSVGGASDADIRDQFETQMDNILNSLEPEGPNFISAVSWFGNLSVSGGTATATYAVEGPYSGVPGDTTPPAAPTGLSAVGGTGQISLSWNANSESDLAGYHVYRAATSGGPYSRLTGSLISGTSYVDSTVSAGSTYYYTVTASDTSSNESGNSNQASASAASDTTPPAAPSGLSASGSAGQASLSWNANTEPDLAGYTVYRASSSGGPYSQLTGVVSATSYTDTSVSPGATYYYVVTASDQASNESGDSNEASASIPNVDTPPSAPTGLSASAQTDQINLNWSANTEPDLAGYHVYRGTSNGGPYSQLTVSVQSGTSYSDTSVAAGSTYYYVVTAVDVAAQESGYSGQVSATTPGGGGPPATPTNLTATAGSNGITLNWDANSESDLAGYVVYRSQPGTSWVIVTPSLLTSNSYLDIDVTAGQYYYYMVRAESTSGQQSGYSDYAAAEAQQGVTPKILIVNATYDGRTDYAAAYEDDLDAAGVAYDLWSIDAQGEPGQSDLAPYASGMVIWSIGYYHSGYNNQLSASAQTTIQNFLNGGGNLVISGAYVAAYLDSTTLFTNYFHCTHVQYDMNIPGITPVSGGVLGSSGWLSFNSTSNQSEVDITAPALASFTWDPYYGQNQSSGTSIFTVDNGYKVVYFAYPYKRLTDYMREDLMDQILTWAVPALVNP